MLYIHIPFCKQACYYCDFHFSTNLELKDKMVEAICREIELRKGYLSSNLLETIYFGGGTPSLLSEKDLSKIFQTIRSNFDISDQVEITLEANPDDLSPANLLIFKNVGINRLSIGIQSFNESHLLQLNRAHNANEAKNCVKNAQNAGFANISIDLIYGIPADSHNILLEDIAMSKQLNVDHISAYCLTIEPKTAFGKWIKSKKMAPIDEEFAAEQFRILMDGLKNNGYEQYEISNFARNQHYSKHNSSYWKGKQYLGIGPSAHSFDGQSRQANISNNNLYIKGIDAGNINFTKEELTDFDKTNEYLLTSIRTIWGTNIDELQKVSNGEFLKENSKIIEKYIAKNWVAKSDNILKLTEEGKYFADLIASELFID